jgi:hypothetical protein
MSTVNSYNIRFTLIKWIYPTQFKFYSIAIGNMALQSSNFDRHALKHIVYHGWQLMRLKLPKNIITTHVQ